ncbi:MAG: class A beta-lactamase-related serine hydrolase [Saprospiraceae bacterium]|nr:class A beta-lactamase-related serine hydrolase [Saprospiraceae bacterium]MDW8484043.1 serine hydrolase [Saprospiraceae bacterium]
MKQPEDPLLTLLSALRQDSIAREVLDHPQRYQLQILYTQIDRQADGTPLFRTFSYHADSTRYFYPASMVKMPLALLALEKINRLRQKGYPTLHRDTPYRIDSLRPFQQRYVSDSTAPNGQLTIAHDIRKIFVVSDNPAYNRLFEFLGIDYINQTLREKGYLRTGIVHRFYAPNRDQRYASPIEFYDPQGQLIYREEEKVGQQKWLNPQHTTALGRGWVNAAGEVINEPFNMQTKNWFALSDMEQMLRAVLFPRAVPDRYRFDLTEDDYRFIWRYMGLFPRECDWPRYDSTQYPDHYVKFFLFPEASQTYKGPLRIFNKVGLAYGTMTDVAYLVDFDNGIEWILAATLLCNADGIFNDDRYEYETIGRPFLRTLSRAIYEYEKRRPRKYKPNLSEFKEVLK